MLTIREDQVEAFRQHHLQVFEEEMVVHLNNFAPVLCQVRGEDCMRNVIRQGVHRAGQYGFTNRGPVRFYIELMISLGSDFDTDPQYPWAGENLRNNELGDQSLRADLLFDQLCRYMDHVAGPKFQHTIEALRRVGVMDCDTTGLSGDIASGLMSTLEKLFPEKYSYVGEPRLRKLVASGLELGSAHKITGERGLIAIVGLMFGVGHGAFRDQLYPWAAATLHDPHVKDPNVRGERLCHKVHLYCKQVLSSLEAEQHHV